MILAIQLFWDQIEILEILLLCALGALIVLTIIGLCQKFVLIPRSKAQLIALNSARAEMIRQALALATADQWIAAPEISPYPFTGWIELS